MDGEQTCDQLDLDDFRALARSSPWLWRTLRFTIDYDSWLGRGPASFRAFVCRPAGVRVETLAGALVLADWQLPSSGPPDPLGEPDRRPDGLVAARPEQRWPGDVRAYDDPMFQTYQWVAMLHPFELADGSDEDRNWIPALAPVTALSGPWEVDHGGRPAWEAVLTTTLSYDPRCSCCPLLDGEQAASIRAREGWPDPRPDLPTSWRVRLHRATGVVVQLVALGGTGGGGWTMRIEEVDADHPRAWFDAHPTFYSGEGDR